MKKTVANITVNNKKYTYSLEAKKGGVIFVECKDANIAQEFLAEDVANLLIDLPNLIIAEKEHKKKQSEIIRFRVSSTDKNKIEEKAVKEGYRSISDYMRHLAQIDDSNQPSCYYLTYFADEKTPSIYKQTSSDTQSSPVYSSDHSSQFVTA